MRVCVPGCIQVRASCRVQPFFGSLLFSVLESWGLLVRRCVGLGGEEISSFGCLKFTSCSSVNKGRGILGIG